MSEIDCGDTRDDALKMVAESRAEREELRKLVREMAEWIRDDLNEDAKEGPQSLLSRADAATKKEVGNG